MNIQTRFTEHGVRRLKERTSLWDFDVDGYISSGHAVLAGRELGSSRVRWIIWSRSDKQAVCVVRDEKTKEVITVLNENHEGKKTIKGPLIGLAKVLDALRYKIKLGQTDLRLLRTCNIKVDLKVVTLLRPAQRWSTAISSVKLPLSDVKNLDKPWRDDLVARRLWAEQFGEQPVPGEVILEQAVVMLGDYSAYISIFPGEIFKRPSS